MRRTTATAIACWFAGCGGLSSAELAAGALRVRESKELHVTYRDRTLIERDSLAGLESMENAESIRAGKAGDIVAFNVIRRKHATLNFRKEVALHENGTLELTIKADHESYTNTPRGYSFSIPLGVLERATFKALTGRSYATKIVEGRISADMPDGGITSAGGGQSFRVRFIAFKSDTLRLVFDFNPYGMTQLYTDYPFSGEPMATAAVEKSGDSLVFTSFAGPAREFGGLYCAKILIYEGEFDYDEKHPYRTWYFRGDPSPIAHFAFGAAEPPKGIIAAGIDLYSEKREYGWQPPAQSMKPVETHAKNTFANCAFSPDGRESTFVADAKPGVYIATLRAGHPERDVGPFDISVNGESVARNVEVSAGDTRSVVVSTYLRAPGEQLRFRFSSEKSWAISSMALQVLIYQNEDYVFDRKLWMVDGLFEPDFRVEAHGLPEAVKAVGGPVSKEALAWRWKMRMVAWARGHPATGFEFNSPELVERRVTELKEQGYNTINDGSLFWNLAYTDRWDEGIAMARMICRFAHKHGMKVVHHMDAPVITYMGTGLQYLMDHLELCQRDIRYGIPTLPHLCINNPGFRREFFGRLVRFARETRVDGFMIDEACFSSKDYCGCPHCRRMFSQATGCALPEDPTSPVFHNYDSPLWVQWMKWRKRSIGDWWVAVRNALAEANPNVCLMKYTTHYGVYGRAPSRDYGVDLMEAARACDFIGTEIMSRNVFDCYRSVFAFRKIKSAIGDHFGGAIWGLVYHLQDKNIAYFGWALNQMNRQTTWMDLIPGADMRRYLDWPDQTDLEDAESVADAAILFSAACRDFARQFIRFRHYNIFDAWGYSEIMNDAHIQHDFILDEGLNREKLSQYKLVILANSSCMSAQQVDAARRYVRDGGTLIVSGNTAMQDENGFWTDNCLLADVMGADYNPAEPLIKGPHTVSLRRDGRTFPYPESSFKIALRADADADVLADIVDEHSRAVAPAIILNRYGKGKCIYLACRLGMVNCETESTALRKWTFEKDPELAALLVHVMTLAGSHGFDVKAVSVPERVLMSTHRQRRPGSGSILVHFLNATGAARLKKGDVVPDRKAEDPFPALAEDLVFDIRMDAPAEAFIVSPDFPGRRPVTVKRTTGGYMRVTVDKADLKAYAIVYLSAESG